jgi:Disaggregatase related
MERNNLLAMALVALVGLSVWAVPCEARLVTVAIVAEVTEVRGTASALQGKVQVGDLITGSYTYDTRAENLWGRDKGWYEFSSPPCGIILEVGGFTFQTDPNDVQFSVKVCNEVITVTGRRDCLQFESFANVLDGNHVNLSYIELYFEDDVSVPEEPYRPLLGLLSPALPLAAPDLRYWPTRELTISGDGLTIVGHLTSAVLVSGPPKLIYVDDDAAAGGDGLSWASAYRTLRDALTDANAAEKPVEVRVARGCYRPDQGAGQVQGDREAAFALLNEVTLRGGYAGLEGADPNARDSQLYQTVLTGDLLGDDLPGFRNRRDNSYHVVTALNTDESALLDGFAIESGHADGLPDDGSPRRDDHTITGGGLHIDGGSVTIRQCTFRGNYAYEYGGGAYVAGFAPRIQQSTFVGNTAGNRGGGAYTDTDVLLQGCVFQGNTALAGGAVLRSDNDLDLYLVNCTVADNRAFEGTPMSETSAGYVWYADIYNSILWNPRYEANYKVFTSGVYHSDVHGEIDLGRYSEGALEADPCFVAPGFWTDPNDLGIEADPNDPSAVWIAGDYHLESQAGHWDAASQSWILDEVTSPCIDAGDPASLIDDEPGPNGARINMGAYGGTPEASKSYPDDG